MLKLRHIVLATMPLLASCLGGRHEGAVYTVALGDFDEVITVDGTVESIHTTQISAPANGGGTIEFLVEDGVYVKEGDVVCRIVHPDMETAREEYTVSLENALAAMEKTRADLQMQYAILEAQVQTNRTQTQISSLDSLQLAYLTPAQRSIKEMELRQVKIESAKLEKKLKNQAVINRSELRKADMQIVLAQNRLEAVEAIIAEHTLRAPRSGLALICDNILIEQDRAYTVGDIIYNGMQVITIPDLTAVKITIPVSETDYKAINLGDSVTYTFGAMPGNTGWGRITKKPPVGEPIKWKSKVKVFNLEASVEHVDTLPEPGLSAVCRIITKHEGGVVSVPQITIFDQDSMKVVYVPLKRGYEQRQVALGTVSPRQAIITAGLKEGEQIVFTRPKASLIKLRTVLPDSLQPVRVAAVDSLTTAEDDESEEEFDELDDL